MNERVRMRRPRTWALLVLVCLLLGTGAVAAREIQQGDQCVVDADQTVDGNLFVLCRTLVLDGHVTGNVLGIATTAVVNGTVDGDLYLLAGQLDVRGTVGEDVHFAGAVMRLHRDATLEGERSDVLSASLSTSIMPGATIPGSVLSVGYQLLQQGDVARELSFWGSSLTISGTVRGNVDAQVGDINADVTQLKTLLIPIPLDIELLAPGLRVSDTARVEGQLTYSGPSEGAIAEGALAREPVYRPVAVQPDFPPLNISQQNPTLGLAIYLSEVFREFLTLFGIGAVLVLLVPRLLQPPMRNVQSRPLVCLGVGLLTFITSFVVIPFVLLFSILLVVVVSLLHVTELTVTVGAILAVLDIGAAASIFFVVIFVSRVLFSLWLGRALVRLFQRQEGGARRGLLALAFGALALALVASLPVVGWLVNALALFVGLGAILTAIQARTEMARANPPVPRYTVAVTTPQLPRRLDDHARSAPPPPPPMIDTAPRPLGMDNLPDGFSWWDDES